MRVLIVAVAVFACAAAAPSGALLAAPFAHGYAGHGLGYAAHGYAAAPLAVAHAAPVALAHGPALPTISPGDIQGAAIDAHVEASDHARAAVDATRGVHDQHSELHGQAVNTAEDHSWQALDAVKTHEAQIDGAAAGVAPVLAKQLAGHVAYAPAVHAGYAAPAIHAGYAAAPVAYAAAPAIHAGYAGYAGAYAAPVAASKTVVTQSLSQSHPAPVVHAPVYAHAPVVAHAPVAYAHGLAHGW